MTRISNILVIFALVTYSSCVTVIPLQSHRVSRPVRRNLETGDPTANIAITNVESILYSGQIQVGTPPQNFSVIFDTGFSDMIFFSNCQGCTGINQYNATISNTSEDQLFNYNFDYYTDNNVVNGEVFEDYITIGGKYSILAEFFVLSTPIGTINNQYDGIIGLNYQGVNPQYPLTTLMQLLQIANTGIPQTFALHLTSQANQTGSTLIIGGYDVITAPNNFTYYPVVQRLTWSLAIDGFGFGSDQTSKGLTDLTITFASGLPYIVAGGSLFNSLLSQLKGITPCSNIVNIDSLYFNISGDIYNVPAASLYTAYPNGTCTLNLQSAVSGGYQNVEDTEILVGIPFLQNYYALFDSDNQMIGLTVPNEIKPQPIPPNGAGIVSISMIFTLFASFLYLLM